MIHSVKFLDVSKPVYKDDTVIHCGFLPFRYDTVVDRVNLWVLLFKARQADRPVPKAVGMLLTLSDDLQLWQYIQEIDEATRPEGVLHNKTGLVNALFALDILGYFHGEICTGDPETCLNPKLQVIMDAVYDRLEAVIDAAQAVPT